VISISDFNIERAEKDQLAGISITEMVIKNGLCAYGTSLAKGKRVTCHSHGEGEEWYIILSGRGTIWTGDSDNDTVKNTRSDPIKSGSVFCIYPGTAHQLIALTDMEFIFLCPPTHITTDRTFFDDIAS